MAAGGDKRAAAEAAAQRAKEAAAALMAKLGALKVTADEAGDDVLARTRTEERVDAIVGLMCEGIWVTGVTHRQLAAQWACSLQRVDQLAQEANRVIRRWLREDPDAKAEQMGRLVVTFERLAQKAEARGSVRGYRDAIEANKMLAQLHGLIKHQVADVTPDPFADYTRDELDEFARTGRKPARLMGTG